MTIAGTSTQGLPAKRLGPANWMRAYGSMLRWEVVGARLFLPLLITVQILAGAGFVLGFGLLIPRVDNATALYLATGAVVMSLILIGLIVTPQLVAQRKMEGSYDFLWSLPVPRSAATAASVSLAALVAVPGIIAALSAAVWRYGVSFSVHPTIVPAFLLTLACGALVGSAIAHGLPQPQITMLISQLLIFFSIGFSPIFFPIDHLPGWLATLHQYLPVYPMALAVRSALTDGLATMTTQAWIVLSVWTLAAAAITGVVLVRRK